MARPDRRGENFIEAPYSAPDDNGADGIDWETGTLTPTELTVEESDGSPSAVPVDTIKLDAADFTLVDNADGSVSVTTDEPDAAAHIADATDAHDASAISYDNTTSGLTATQVQAAIDEIAAGGGGGGITIQDEGSPLTTAATTLDFVGAGVTATGAGATKTITIPGGGGGGSLVWLATFTASASATLDCTGFISGTYTNYLCIIQNLVPATNNVDLYMRVGTGGGPTYQSGASDYNTALFAHASSGSANSGGTASRIPLRGSATDISNTASKGGVSGSFILFNPGSGAIETSLVGTFGYWTTQSVGVETKAQYLATTAVTAFQFLMSSGNIASGLVRWYGIANS